MLTKCIAKHRYSVTGKTTLLKCLLCQFMLLGKSVFVKKPFIFRNLFLHVSNCSEFEMLCINLSDYFYIKLVFVVKYAIFRYHKGIFKYVAKIQQNL